MEGISMEELYEMISWHHDAEFEYRGTTYVLQPEWNGDIQDLVIWDCTPDSAKCIARHRVENEGDIPKSVIDAVLSEKCFDGKSFLEIEKEIVVTVIF